MERQYKSTEAQRKAALTYYYSHREEILERRKKPEVKEQTQNNTRIWRERRREHLREYSREYARKLRSGEPQRRVKLPFICRKCKFRTDADWKLEAHKKTHSKPAKQAIPKTAKNS